MISLFESRQRIIQLLETRKNQVTLNWLVALLIGTVSFVVLFGVQTLNPTHVDWIYIRGGDVLQHQLGWMAFRAEPWSLKLGAITSLLYPTGTSIVYTDSIPLLAVFFKLFRAWLPETFQYFGLWTLLNWILTAWFAIYLFSKLNLSRVAQYLGAILLTVSPVLIDRTFHHDGLIAHWLLLAAFALIVTHLKSGFPFKSWIFLVTVSLWIHAYLFVMVVAFYVASLLYEWIHTRSWMRILLNVLVAAALCAVSAYTLGLFDSPAQMRSKNVAHYSANLNALLNPIESSRLFGPLPFAFEGQYEGYAYLGVGTLLLAAASLLAGGRVSWKRENLKYLTLLLPALAMAMFSTGGTITAGSHVVYDIPLLKMVEDLFLVLRSNGRFIWSLYYLIIIFLVSRIDRPRFLRWVLIVVIAIQLFEFSPLIQSKTYIRKTGYVPPLSSNFWQGPASSYQHLVIFPEEDTLYFYPPFGSFAVEHGLTLNWMYLARADYRWLERYYGDVLEELYQGKLDKRTIYIAANKRIPNTLIRLETPGVLVCSENNYWIIVNDNPGQPNPFAEMAHCQP
jgi:hypothetical protein